MAKYAIHTKWSWPNGVPSAETIQARPREIRSETKAEDIIWFKIDENTHQSVIIFAGFGFDFDRFGVRWVGANFFLSCQSYK